MTLGNAQKANFAPRLGFAYRVTPSVAVRGGYGIAYGALGNLGYGGTLGTNYPFVYTSTFNSPDSQHPLPLPNGATATMENAFAQINISDPTVNSGQGLNLYGRQYNFQTPYIQSFNLTVQDQFTNHDSIQVGYVATVGRHLDNLGYFNSPSQLLPISANPQNYVPFPSFARNATYETTNGTSSYNSLQMTYEHQLSLGLTVLANYTYSKCLSNQHTQASQNQQYRAEWLPGFGITSDYSLCDTDATNVVHLAPQYQLPFGRGRTYLANVNKATDFLVGGWNVNFIYTYQTGQPFTVTCPVATTASGVFGCFANVVPGANVYGGQHNYLQWLNPAAFAQPPAVTAVGQTNYAPLGGSPQQARGPHFNNLDISILKNFTFTERIRLQFRAEAFNATNTTPLAQPGSLNFHDHALCNHYERTRWRQCLPPPATRVEAVLLNADTVAVSQPMETFRSRIRFGTSPFFLQVPGSIHVPVTSPLPFPVQSTKTGSCSPRGTAMRRGRGREFLPWMPSSDKNRGRVCRVFHWWCG